MSIVAEAVRDSLGRSSWIRRMFEEGSRLKAERGEANVCDFSLGNPILEPPAEVAEALRELVLHPAPGMHRYIPNPGLPVVRAHVAAELAAATGRPFKAGNVVMTCGAAGGLNILFKALLNPGDEVVALAPTLWSMIFTPPTMAGVWCGFPPARVSRLTWRRWRQP